MEPKFPLNVTVKKLEIDNIAGLKSSFCSNLK